MTDQTWMKVTTVDKTPIWEGYTSLLPNLGEYLMVPPHRTVLTVKSVMVVIGLPGRGDYCDIVVENPK
jgi:hypothetical protein